MIEIPYLAAVKKALRSQEIETPSWAFGNSGTRFKVFAQQGVPRTGREVEVVHIVGGGSRNELLCQLTADACGLPVLAGPVEASALGNVLVQARTLGAQLPDLEAMRVLVAGTHDVRRYEPQGRGADWDAAEAHVCGGGL